MPPGPRSDSAADGEEEKPSPLERLRRAMLKPTDDGGYAPSSVKELSVEELMEANRALNDRERLIGFVAAPIAALIGLLIIDANINHDPAQFLSSGAVNPKYTSISLYHELGVVLLVMAALMIVTSYLRKRFFLGVVLALYGLAVFNLHYWGFGIPFLLGGAWYLVRTYRIQASLKEAGVDVPGMRGRATAGPPTRQQGRLPRPNKRYTPRTAPRPRPPKPEKD
jgi:hypothetical protein